MARPPRPRGQSLLPGHLLARIAAAGGFTAAAAFALMLTHEGTPDHVRWLAFSSLVIGQAVRANGNRSLTRPVTSLRPNLLLAGAAVIVVLVQLAIPYVPPLAEAFRATTLDSSDWLLIAIIALTPALVAEVIRRVTGWEWVA